MKINLTKLLEKTEFKDEQNTSAAHYIKKDNDSTSLDRSYSFEMDADN